jgi:uncharacterized membrane protein YhaH (DUF805 family)
MLTAVFKFRGRINRSQYLLGNLATGAIFVVLAQLLMDFGHQSEASRSPLPMAVNAVLLVMATPLAAWIAISLQARRLRDIGWEPLIAIPIWIAALVVVGMAAQSSPDAAQVQTAAGTLINFAALTFLLAWPGRRGGISSISDGGRLMALAPASPRTCRRSSAAPPGDRPRPPRSDAGTHR